MKGAWPLLVIAALFGGAALVLVYIWATLPDGANRLLAIAGGSLAIAGAAARSVREHVREETRRERERPAELPRARVVEHGEPPSAPRVDPKPPTAHAPIVVEHAPRARTDVPMREGNPDDKPKILT